jgi:hypothetical protein
MNLFLLLLVAISLYFHCSLGFFSAHNLKNCVAMKMTKKFSDYFAEAVTTVEGAEVSKDVLASIAYRLVLKDKDYEFKIKSLKAYYSQKLSFISQRSVLNRFELK